MILDLIFNAICSHSLEKKREKIKRKIDDIIAYRELALVEINNAKEIYNVKLNEIVNFLNGIRNEVEMNFKTIVQKELYEAADIIRKSYDLLFILIDYNAQIKILNYKKNYHRTEINFFKKRKLECSKIIKVLSLSNRKDARLKWFNEANGTNVKTIDDIKKLKGNYYHINLLIDLCEKDLKNYRKIKKLIKYIKVSDEKIHFIYDKVKDIDIKIEKLTGTLFKYLEDYNKLYSEYLNILNRKFDIDDIFPSYKTIFNKKERMIKIHKYLSFFISLISHKNSALKSNDKFLKLNEKLYYYKNTFKQLLKTRRESINSLYHNCVKRMIKYENGGYLIILNKEDKTSNIFISYSSNDSNKETTKY